MMIGARTAAWSVKKLPYLRRVAYLESHGTEYIDTGLFANTGEGVDHVDGIEYRFNSTRSIEWDFTFGTENGPRSQRFAMWSSELQNHQFAVRYSPISQNFSGFNINTDYDISFKNGIVKIDGVEKVRDDISFAIRGTVWIFGINWLEFGIDNDNPFAGKIYFADLYWRDDLRMSLIPVLDLSGRPCMYNQAPSAVPADDPSRFFYNKGSGEFTTDLDVQT